MMVEIQIIKYRGFLLFIEGFSCVFCDSMSTGTFTTGGFLIFILSGGSRKLNLGTDIFCTSAAYIGGGGILKMCQYIFVFFVAAAIAHLIPKQSQYAFHGIGMNNSYIEWSPSYKELHGMFFFHAIGNSTLSFDNTVIKVSDVRFFHAYGHMPDIFCESAKRCKVVAHLIT